MIVGTDVPASIVEITLAKSVVPSTINISWKRFPSWVTKNKDFDPPAIEIGCREDKTSENTGNLIFDPFKPPS